MLRFLISGWSSIHRQTFRAYIIFKKHQKFQNFYLSIYELILYYKAINGIFMTIIQYRFIPGYRSSMFPPTYMHPYPHTLSYPICMLQWSPCQFFLEVKKKQQHTWSIVISECWIGLEAVTIMFRDKKGLKGFNLFLEVDFGRQKWP